MQCGYFVIEIDDGRDVSGPAQPRGIFVVLERQRRRRAGKIQVQQGIAVPGGLSVRREVDKRRCGREAQDGSGSPLSTGCIDLWTTGTCWI